ncbi:MAG: DUF2029 domain-containing protein [Lachnospiraceae bacterium]|nr:DUF2029 domain-containing protein [Lachnospiraceae bacterium]
MIKLYENEKIKNLILLILAALAALSVFQGCRNAIEWSQDFQWDAAKVFMMRIDPYEESLSPSGILDTFGYEEYYLQMEANQFPSLLMLLAPFTLLSPLSARYTWLAFNLLFTVGIIILLRKTFLKSADPFIFRFFVLFMLAGTPYRNQLGVGQHTLFAFFFFLLAVYCLEIKGLRGFLLTSLSLFICYFKYTLTVPLAIYFIYRRKYKEVGVSVLFHLILTIFSALWLGDSFINMIIKPLKVSSALLAEGGIDLGAIFKGSLIAYILAFVILIALLLYAVRLKEGYDGVLISVLTLFSLVITYHRTYDFFVLIVVIALFYNIETSAYMKAYYFLMMIYINFILRLFSENLLSRIGAGIIYYGFIIYVCFVLFREHTLRNGEKGQIPEKRGF